MRKIFSIITGLLLAAGVYYLASISGINDKTFRELDELITLEHNQLRSDYVQMKINQKHYIEKIKKLSKKEDDLLNEVKLYKFDDITEHNYWHRGRLKFPSNIKMELEVIKKAEKDSS